MEDMGMTADLLDLSALRGKKVLLTGHTGFKGAWLAIWLDLLGAEVVGLALDPDDGAGYAGIFTASGIGARLRDYRQDIRDLDGLLAVFAAEQPEVVFHLAAQAIVLESYAQPAATFAVNTQGTVNVLEAIRQTPSVRAAVMVTTDKCYENKEWVHGYREEDPMGGHDPYSASKGAAEIAISAYRRSFFAKKGANIEIASARAGNVIGGGDWSAKRLVPDILRAIERDQILEIRSPEAVRPWQHVLEPLGGYLVLADRLLREAGVYADAWNFGPQPGNVLPVRAMADAFFQYFERGQWKDVSTPGQPHEAGLLMLEINKAVHRLGWRPVLDFYESIEMTADWYARYRETDVLQLCRDQIAQYNELWKSRNGNSPVFSRSASPLT